jgi:hypothetical protein
VWLSGRYAGPIYMIVRRFSAILDPKLSRIKMGSVPLCRRYDYPLDYIADI